MTGRLRSVAIGVLASAAALGLATGAVYALRPFAPVLSLGVLYVVAVLGVAVWFGISYAIPVSVASMLAFNWFFLPPLHTFRLADSANWFALGVYVATAVVVSELAARSRRRAAEAEQREREASLLAGVSVVLLEPGHVQDKLRPIAERAAGALAVSHARIELESLRRSTVSEQALPLAAAGRDVGRLFVPLAEAVPAEAAARVLPALASLLAVALERERLAYQAVDAEALRRSDAIKTAVLRSVSHDFRSPLTAIRAAAEGLADTTLRLDESDRDDLLSTIRAEARRLERLVANLLDLSRLEGGAAEPRPELWPVDALVGRALEAVGAESQRVVVSGAVDPPVRVDAAQVERVLVNLLENAIKFSPPDARVEVRLVRDNGEAVIRVSDHGPGLDPKELEWIFEPFEQGRRPGPRTGSGLGLAIARGFAEANSARLWAESPPGAGASFVLALPLGEPRG